MIHRLPPELRPAIARAERLEWWSIGWTVSVIVVMGLAMGGSQAMKTAWIEDCLSLLAPIVFLIAVRVERRPPSPRFPSGFARAPGLAFAIAAAALAALGGTLLFDAATGLLHGERATIVNVEIAGREVWLGWLMEAAQVYSIIVPLVLGWIKLPLARQLSDKTLYTDAMTQKANWMTGIAGLGGVLGIGLGYWWADAAAAGIIALDILNDGLRALRAATAELVDGAPRELDSNDVADEAGALHAALDRRFPGTDIRLRSNGRVMVAEVHGAVPPAEQVDPADCWPGKPDRAWRLEHVSFVPAGEERDGEGEDAPDPPSRSS